jgi:predicted RNA methylase
MTRDNEMYEIYDNQFNKIDKSLIPETFNLSPTYNTLNTMEKDMRCIHNYIRDYTKISNEDKSFFVACILISIRKESFCILMDNYKGTRYVYDIMKENLLEAGIDISVFEFLRNDENNQHFIHIIRMVRKVYELDSSSDLLNKFYTEFVRYSKTDGKSLGIVLTPEHIVTLMIDLLDIQPDDIFLDICSGTGSFVLEALKRHPIYIIAVEYQNKLFSLLKCNMILRDACINTNRLVKGDCFDNEFKATKSAINPPYGMRDKKELDFVIKQLDSVTEGGVVAAIVPCSCLSKSEARSYIFKHSIIRRIVICNNNLFYPNAGVKTCILLLEKRTNPDPLQRVTLDNFECDGFEIKRQRGRVLISDPVHKESVIHISDNQETWIQFEVDSDIDRVSLQLRRLEIEYHMKKLELLRSASRDRVILNRTRTFYIHELFDVIKTPSTPYEYSHTVYDISARNNNNGIKKTTLSDKKTFTGNKIVLVTGGDGGAGLAHYQPYPFTTSSSTVVLSPKEECITLDM